MKSFFKYLLLLVFLGALVVTGTGLVLKYFNGEVVTEDYVREVQDTNAILNNPQSAFSNLSLEEQQTYLRICNEIEGINESFSLIGNAVNDEQLNRIAGAILRDHPEYFYVDQIQYLKDYSGNVELVQIQYNASPEEIEQQKLQVAAWRDGILSQITDSMTNYDIALFIHDYLVNTVNYDINSVNNQNILSVVQNASSVCAGYTKAYQYLLNQAGIFATYVSGDVGGGSHAWNLVQIDGEYGWIDITWDDPSFLNEEPFNVISHSNFGLSTEELLKTHTFDEPLESYSAIGTPSFNYFDRQGTHINMDDPFSFLSFKQKFMESRGRGDAMFEVRLENTDQIEELLTEISYDGSFFQGTLNYFVDPYYPIITFVF